MKVYIADLEKIGNISDMEKFLSVSEHDKYTKFSNKTRKLQFLTARFIVFNVLQEHISIDENGKPFVKNGFISISHKDNFVVVAFDDKNVGIDIENAVKERDFINESKLLGLPIPTSREDFYKNFVKYESDIKYGQSFDRANHMFYKFNDYMIGICTKSDNIEFVFFNCDGVVCRA